MKTYIRCIPLCLMLGAGAAAAQSSSVTIYGVADAGMQFIDADGDGGSHSKLGVVSGGRNGSRLGLRGNEDLGDGLSAIFTLEQGYDFTDGNLGQGGRMWGRQAFVGLKGGFGTLALGRIATFSAGSGAFDMFGDVDPFMTSYGISGVGSTLSSASGLRTDNTVVYMSPSWNGWRVGAAHSFNFDGETQFGRHDNLYVTSLGLQYANGPVTAALTYDSLNNPAGGRDERHYQLGAAYDFEVVKLFAAVGYESGQFSPDFNITGTTNGANARAWMVGLSAPLGAAGTVRLSYQNRDGERVRGDERDVSVLSVGYEYNLSKRTMLYAAIADSNGRHTLDDDPDFDRRVYTVGVAHRF